MEMVAKITALKTMTMIMTEFPMHLTIVKTVMWVDLSAVTDHDSMDVKKILKTWMTTMMVF